VFATRLHNGIKTIFAQLHCILPGILLPKVLRYLTNCLMPAADVASVLTLYPSHRDPAAIQLK
jgi:hypothetical protein